MFFWIFFLLVTYLCFSKYYVAGKQKSKILEIIGILFIVFISAVRFDVGWDYKGYYSLIFPYPDYEYIDKMEPISREIIMTSIHSSYPPLMFIIFSLLTYGIVGLVIFKDFSNRYISILIYLAFFYISTLSVIRQGLAISIVLLAISNLKHNKYILSLILVVLAYFIHYSSIIAITFIPIYYLCKRSNFILIISVCIIGIFSVNKLIEYFLPGYLHYLESTNEYSGGSLMKFLMLGLIGFVSYNGMKKNDLDVIKLSCISSIGILFPFLIGGHIGGRIALYFYTPLILTIPIVLDNINIKSIKTISIYLLNLIFIWSVVTDIKSHNNSTLTPYKTIITEDIYSPKFK